MNTLGSYLGLFLFQKVFFASKSYVTRKISNIPGNDQLKTVNSPTLAQVPGPKQLGFTLRQ